MSGRLHEWVHRLWNLGNQSLARGPCMMPKDPGKPSRHLGEEHPTDSLAVSGAHGHPGNCHLGQSKGQHKHGFHVASRRQGGWAAPSVVGFSVSSHGPSTLLPGKPWKWQRLSPAPSPQKAGPGTNCSSENLYHTAFQFLKPLPTHELISSSPGGQAEPLTLISEAPFSRWEHGGPER